MCSRIVVAAGAAGRAAPGLVGRLVDRLLARWERPRDVGPSRADVEREPARPFHVSADDDGH
jgi:hypothetical protein